MPKPMSILDYHQRSKHNLRAYAPGPGYLDWANQPNPFREFKGASRIELPFAADLVLAPYLDLRQGRLPSPARFDLEHVGALLELSLGLSAWKEYRGSRWALRCNPSSGNLHPTEGYLIVPSLPGIPAGVHHYVSRDHTLEHRAAVEESTLDGTFGNAGLFVALTSIHWREAWKYGLRAYRYCQHDCGHALAAVAYAAAALGWPARLVSGVSDADLADLTGTSRGEDFAAAEPEAVDALLWLGSREAAPDPSSLIRLARAASWHGRANRLSPDHVRWGGIEEAHGAASKPSADVQANWKAPARPPALAPALDLPGARIFRQRRSAVDFDGVTEISADAFYAMLDATLPRPSVPPWNAWPEAPRVHLGLFVHRVTGLQPGLYFLVREATAFDGLAAAMRGEWLWQHVGPEHLPLYLLLPHDLRQGAKLISCHQGIAADSCFALGMVASFAGVEAEPWRYRQLYWECGMIGQTLYLEAEAAGLRGTGIGCFFDDEMHRVLGLTGSGWQSLYHFTVGGPIDDPRLTTYPPYAALRERNGRS
jgi:SagB-type dehydrogenase family enzyme